MSAPAVFQPAYTTISGQLSVFVNDRAASVVGQVQAPLQAAIALYFVLYGFAIWRGAISEPVTDIAIRGIKLAFIWAIAATASNYSMFVTTPLFTTFPSEIAQAVSGTGAQGAPGQPFDQFMGYAWDLGNQDFQKGGTFPALNLPLIFSGAIVILIGTAAAALGFAIFMMSLVALAILITLGPIFVALVLFDVTRRFFFGWLAQAMNYLLLYALIITIFQMILSLVAQQWVETPDDPAIASFELVALSVLGAIFCLHTPNLAAGIAGGAAAGIADFGRALSHLPRGGTGSPASQSAAARLSGGRIIGRA